MDKENFTAASKDLCELMIKQIKTDDRIEDAFDALTVLHTAASYISAQYSADSCHFALVPAEIAQLLTKFSLARIAATNAKSQEEADAAIKKAMSK